MNRNIACLAPSFVSSLNVITDSNRFYQCDRTSKLPEETCNLPKPSQNMQSIPERYRSWLWGCSYPMSRWKIIPKLHPQAWIPAK